MDIDLYAKIKELDEKLEKLREEYKTAAVSRREVIVLQGRALRIARDGYAKKSSFL